MRLYCGTARNRKSALQCGSWNWGRPCDEQTARDEKAHHIAAAVTRDGLVKRRDYSSGTIMARTLEGATPYSFRNEIVLSELHGMKKHITLRQL